MAMELGKDLKLGEGAPMIIVPVMEKSIPASIEAMRAAARAGADIVEWRFDAVLDALKNAEEAGQLGEVLGEELHKVAEALPDTPLLLTMRSKAQGGLVDAVGFQYAALVSMLASNEAGSLVDIELTAGLRHVRKLIALAHKNGKLAVISQHDFAKTPDTQDMVATLIRMRELGADVCKLAVMANSPADAARLMEATAIARDRIDGASLLTMAMGLHGAITRLSGEAFGSCATFASLEQASAPGQMSLDATRNAIDALHAALS